MQRFRPFVSDSRVLSRGIQHALQQGLLWSPSLRFPHINYQFVSDDKCWSKIHNALYWGCAEPKLTDVEFMRAFFERRMDPYQTSLSWKSTILTAEREENKFHTMTILLGEAIIRFPSEHERVIDLMGAMYEIEAATTRRDRRFACTPIDLRDVLWNYIDDPPDHERGFEWINSCAFWARNAIRDMSDYNVTFLIKFGAAEISIMLEKSRSEPMDYDIYLPACCQWLKIIGKDLYRLRHQPDAFDPQLTDYELWTGKPDFSSERWQFWKEWVLKLRDLSVISDQSKRVADETIAEMNRIEATAEADPPWDYRFGRKTWEDYQVRGQNLSRQQRLSLQRKLSLQDSCS